MGDDARYICGNWAFVYLSSTLRRVNDVTRFWDHCCNCCTKITEIGAWAFVAPTCRRTGHRSVQMWSWRQMVTSRGCQWSSSAAHAQSTCATFHSTSRTARCSSRRGLTTASSLTLSKSVRLSLGSRMWSILIVVHVLPKTLSDL